MKEITRTITYSFVTLVGYDGNKMASYLYPGDWSKISDLQRFRFICGHDMSYCADYDVVTETLTMPIEEFIINAKKNKEEN